MSETKMPASLHPHAALRRRLLLCAALLLGRGVGVGSWIWLMLGHVQCSSNSSSARILVLGTSGAHWPARWPQFELTERVDKS